MDSLAQDGFRSRKWIIILVTFAELGSFFLVFFGMFQANARASRLRQMQVSVVELGDICL